MSLWWLFLIIPVGWLLLIILFIWFWSRMPHNDRHNDGWY